MTPWPQATLGDVVIAKSGNGKIIKGTLATKNDGRLFPAYSATGQDVFSEEYDHEGDGIVVSAVGARCGKCFFATGRWRAIANTHVLLPRKDKVLPRFLWYLVNDENFWVRGGTAQPFVKVMDSLRNPIPLPPIADQERIVGILDEADALRRLRIQADDRTQCVVPAIYQEMVGNHLNEFKVETLDSVCTDIYRYPTYFGITYEASGVPEVRGELLNDDYTIDSSPEKLRFISDETSKRFPRTILRTGDLIMSVRGTVGKLGIVPPALDGGNMTANLLRISPKREVLNPLYLLMFFVHGQGLAHVATLSDSTTIQTIKAGEFRRMGVPIPPMPLQEKFASHMAEIGALESIQRDSRNSLDDIFKSALHHAVGGRI